MFLRILALIGEAPNQTKSSTESEADPEKLGYSPALTVLRGSCGAFKMWRKFI
jgi:hypothetical protein